MATAAMEVRVQNRLGLHNPPLTTTESIALEALKQIVSEGRRATLAELCAATGIMYQSGGVPRVLQKLEEKGYITRQIFQRGMIVCFPDGKCTAAPPDLTPHWRVRTDRVPAPAIQAIRQRDRSAAERLEGLARRIDMPIHELSMRCTLVGLDEIERKIEEDGE